MASIYLTTAQELLCRPCAQYTAVGQKAAVLSSSQMKAGPKLKLVSVAEYHVCADGQLYSAWGLSWNLFRRMGNFCSLKSYYPCKEDFKKKLKSEKKMSISYRAGLQCLVKTPDLQAALGF